MVSYYYSKINYYFVLIFLISNKYWLVYYIVNENYQYILGYIVKPDWKWQMLENNFDKVKLTFEVRSLRNLVFVQSRGMKWCHCIRNRPQRG